MDLIERKHVIGVKCNSKADSYLTANSVTFDISKENTIWAFPLENQIVLNANGGVDWVDKV